MAKKKILTEAEIDRTYQIVKGFNLPDGRRFEAGNNFVSEKNFSTSDWKALVEMEAVQKVETPEVREDETVVFEKVEK